MFGQLAPAVMPTVMSRLVGYHARVSTSWQVCWFQWSINSADFILEAFLMMLRAYVNDSRCIVSIFCFCRGAVSVRLARSMSWLSSPYSCRNRAYW